MAGLLKERLGEEPEPGFSYRTLKFYAFTVTGGAHGDPGGTAASPGTGSPMGNSPDSSRRRTGKVPRQQIDHSGITCRLPGDFPERLWRGRGQSGAETHPPPGNRPGRREAMTLQPREPGERVPAALYVRPAGGDPDDSLETQLESLQGYARRNGLEVVRVYFDTRGDRSQFDRMMAEAAWENPPFRRILAAGYDRLAGPGEELQGWKKWLKEKGVAVVSITDPSGNPEAT